MEEHGKSGEGNVYRCYVTGVTALTGDALSGTDPNATYTDGTAQFKYEPYIGPNGANPYDYYLDTDRDGAYSLIRNMQFWTFGSRGCPIQAGISGQISMAGRVMDCSIAPLLPGSDAV